MKSYDYNKYKDLYNTDKELTNIVDGEDTVIKKLYSIIKRCSSKIDKEDSNLFEELISNIKWFYQFSEKSNHIENSLRTVWLEFNNGDWKVPENDYFYDSYQKIARRVKMSDDDFISAYYESICGIVKYWQEFYFNPVCMQHEIIKDDGTLGFVDTIEIYNKNVASFNKTLTVVRKLIVLEKKYSKTLNIFRDYKFFKEIENGLEVKSL